MKRPKPPEAALAAVVVRWLESQDADVYQEVAVLGGIADIVAKVGAEIWIVETKNAFSLALIAQGIDRRRHAHRVYIAAPHTKSLHEVEMLCRELGIGCLVVSTPSTYEPEGRVQMRCDSRRWNTRPVAIAGKLRPEHKTAAPAGVANGAGRWTPYRDTCRQLAHVVAVEPGITLKDAVERITHHYASRHSARASLVRWIEAGKVNGVRLERRDGKTCLQPTEQAA